VDADDGVPFVGGHVEDHAVAEDPGDVDEDVEAAVLADGGLDEVLGGFVVGDVGAVSDGAAAGLGDFLDDLPGRPGVVPGPVQGRAEVVDDHRGALPGQQQRHRPPDPAARTRHDRYALIQGTHVRTGLPRPELGHYQN
jgi:hypothetical protein